MHPAKQLNKRIVWIVNRPHIYECYIKFAFVLIRALSVNVVREKSVVAI